MNTKAAAIRSAEARCVIAIIAIVYHMPIHACFVLPRLDDRYFQASPAMDEVCARFGHPAAPPYGWRWSCNEMKRSAHITFSSITGCIAGFVSAWLIWHMIYSVGSRVIQDWEYEKYLETVVVCGGLVGLVLGLLSGLFTWHPISVVIVGQGLAIADFVLSPYVSWRDGLANYSVALLVSTAVIGFVSRLIPKIRQALAQNKQ